MDIFEAIPLPLRTERSRELHGVSASTVRFSSWTHDGLRNRLARFGPLCKVLRQFNLVATPFLYRHFRLDARVPPGITDLESCQRSVVRGLGSYLTVLQSNRNLGEHCQSLELILDYLSLNDAMRDALDQVLRQMPNLKRLRLCLSHVGALCQWNSYSGVAGAESGLVRLLSPYMPQMEELSMEITTESWPLIPRERLVRIREWDREYPPLADSISRVRASPAGELLGLLEHAPRLEALQIVRLLSKSAWQNVDSRLGLQLSAKPVTRQNAIFSNMTSLSLPSYWAGHDHHLWPVLRNIKNLQHFAIDFGNGSSLGDVEKPVAVFSAGFWDLLLLHKKSLRSLALPCTGLDLDWRNKLRKPSPDWSPYAKFADFEALEELTLALYGPYSLAGPVRVRSHAPPRLKRLLLSFWRPDFKLGFLPESWVRFGSGRLSLVSMFIDAARNTGLKEAIIEGIMSENSNQKECARLISQWRQWGVKTTFFDPETCEITVDRVPRPRPIPHGLKCQSEVVNSWRRNFCW